MKKDEVQRKLFRIYSDIQEVFTGCPTPELAERVAETYEDWLRICDVPADIFAESAKAKRENLLRYMAAYKLREAHRQATACNPSQLP